MSEEEFNSTLDEMKKNLPELEELIETNWYHWLLKQWGKLFLTPIIGLIIGMFLAFLIPNDVNIPLPISLTESQISETAKTIFGPSITIIGLVITFTPVIAFFYINDLKEGLRELNRIRKTETSSYSKNKKFLTKENKAIFDNFYNYSYVVTHNKISGVLKYVKTVIGSSLLLLPLLIEAFIFLNPGIFSFSVLMLLISIILSISPILAIATYKPAFKIKQYIIPAKVVRKIELED